MGASGRILHYADTSWSLMNSGVGSELRGIYGFSSINAYVVGANGTILHYKEPAPIITTISPNQGNQGQSLAITITGSNFAEATAIDLGSGIDIADWNIDSNLQISANITISSSAPTGPRDLSITNPYGTGTLPDAFLVPHPAVTSVTPDTGNQGETIAVTISGSNLGGTTAVNFGLGISPDALEISSPSTLSLTISIAEDAISGPREVLVMTPDHVTAWSSFVIPTATGDSVNPDSAVQGETVVVSITGNNLFGATGVSFGDNVTVSSFDVVSPTQINASITIDGLASPGSRTISIVTPSGTVTMADAFQVISASPPSVSSLSPTSGTQGQTLEVVIDGTDFERVTSVDFGEGITVNAVTINSPTRITVSITISETALPGARDLSVLALSGSDSLNDAFGVTAAPLPVPTVSGISPASARQGETLDVVITGTNLDGVTSIELGEGIKVNSFTVDSPTQITLNLTVGDDAASGPRDVQVTGPGGSDSLSAGLEVEGSGGTPFWVWILIALIPLLLILFFLLLKRKKQEQESRA